VKTLISIVLLLVPTNERYCLLLSSSISLSKLSDLGHKCIAFVD